MVPSFLLLIDTIGCTRILESNGIEDGELAGKTHDERVDDIPGGRAGHGVRGLCGLDAVAKRLGSSVRLRSLRWNRNRGSSGAIATIVAANAMDPF